MVMRDLLAEGLLLFNQGRFYDAHEVWEDLWRATVDPTLKTCYQGLIQAAVGLHHLGHDNLIGAQSQLKKSIRNLRAGAADTTGIDIDRLIVDLSELLDRMPALAHTVRIAPLK
jgi:predicted metal-dependent hydrolase